jgi:cyanophycin synthetase
MVVDLGSLEEFPTTRIPGFSDALMALMPSLIEHACSIGERGGFLQRMRDGTWLGHVAEHVALELQSLAGTDVRYGKTRTTGKPGEYNVIYEYREEHVGIQAGHSAVDLVNHLVAPDDPNHPFDFPLRLESLIRLAERQAFGPSTQALVDEAANRDIPFIRLDSHSLIQLGQGSYQQRLRATMTSRTSAIAVDLASDKSLTNRLLGAAGLPVPRLQVADDVEAAVTAAGEIGYPVVVKPLDGNHGRGVVLDLRDDDAVRAAFPAALAETRSGTVVVESHVTGDDYRILVVDGKMAAVAQRVPASVVGDGKHSVSELVESANSDPRRGIGHEKVLTRIRLDERAEELVRAQGFALSDVPPKGTAVKLALTGNMSTGGTSIDRTNEAHLENIEIAETAAQVVGLDVAGIDFIVPDIGIPVREQGGAIVEVNAAPGFRMHTHPTEGESQYVAKAVVDMLFPPGTPARIPIVAVSGTNGKTTTVRMIAHVLKQMGRRVGYTSTDGIFIDGRLIKRGDMSGPKSARMVLQNPTVDAAIFEVARGGILREGLGYDRNDVAVITNISGDHLGLGGIETLGQLASVKGVLVQAVPRTGSAVLNADDPLVARMARHSDGQVVYFSMEKPGSRAWDRVDSHCHRGGAAVILEERPDGELVVLRIGSRRMPLLFTHLIPATFGGLARMNVANALAAAAAAWATGAHLNDIREGLRTFTTSFYQAPGRLNFVEVDGFRLFIDYCHNVGGMRRLTEFVDGLVARRPGRTIAVIGIPGDRRDDDMRAFGSVAARTFDEVIVREDRNLRGRAPGATAQRVVEGIEAARGDGARVNKVDIVLNELEAARTALGRAQAGDLLVVCADDAGAVYGEAMRLAQKATGDVAISAPGEMSVDEG